MAKSDTLRLRLHPYTKDRLREAAAARDVTISEYVRGLLTRELEIEPGGVPPEDWRERVQTR